MWRAVMLPLALCIVGAGCGSNLQQGTSEVSAVPTSASRVAEGRVQKRNEVGGATVSTTVAPPPPSASAPDAAQSPLAPQPSSFTPGTTSPSPLSGFPLPTWSGDSVPAALHSFSIVGVPEAQCVMLREGDATAPSRLYAALWPEGFRVKFAPLRIIDGRDTVWQEDDGVHWVGGGFSSQFVERIPPACRQGDQAWWVVSPNESAPS